MPVIDDESGFETDKGFFCFFVVRECDLWFFVFLKDPTLECGMK
jgi:hypothetical protein